MAIVLVGNKNDLRDESSVSEEEAQQVAEEFECPLFFTSAKTGENVEASFLELLKIMDANKFVRIKVSQTCSS